MKTKTISAIIRKKFDLWTATITDDAVREAVEKNSVVTGGCIASMLLNEKVNDFDVYFTDRETVALVAEHYVKVRNGPGAEAGEGGSVWVRDAEDGRVMLTGALGAAPGVSAEVQEALEDEGPPPAAEENKNLFLPVFLSANAITLSDGIQLVIRFYGPPEEIHKNFDFIHCTCFWTSAENKVVTNLPALESLLAKELRYSGSRYPLCSIIRTRKFVARGWRINAGQYLKMALQLNSMNLLDVQVLREQLVGVDAAYFCDLIRKLQEGDPEKIDAAYVCEIVDRMF